IASHLWGFLMHLRSAFWLCVCFFLGAPLHAGSSSSLMDLSPDGSRLLVTNADSGSVSVIDTTTRKVLHEVKVGDKPEGAAWIGDGPRAAVTVHREDTVVFLDAALGKVVKRLAVTAEPYGIVANRDGSRLWVTHEYPGVVSEIDAREMKVLRTLPAGSFLRGLALAGDEKRLYVSEFSTVAISPLDLASGQVADTWKAQSTDNLSRQIALHPRRPKAYLPHIRSRIEVIDGSGSIFPQMTIYDLVPPEKDRKRRT